MKAVVHESHTDIFPTDGEVKRLCKPGAGADTCAWLVIGGGGWQCVSMNKPHALLDRWIKGETVAKRDGCVPVNTFSPFGKEGEVEIPVPAEAKAA